MPRYEVLVPTVEVKCLQGHVITIELEQGVFVKAVCSECGRGSVNGIKWVGMTPKYIEGEKV